VNIVHNIPTGRDSGAGGAGGGFSSPTFGEDDIFFVFVLVYVYFTLYPG